MDSQHSCVHKFCFGFFLILVSVPGKRITKMNKYVLNQNTTLMCTHDFCYFLVLILGI